MSPFPMSRAISLQCVSPAGHKLQIDGILLGNHYPAHEEPPREGNSNSCTKSYARRGRSIPLIFQGMLMVVEEVKKAALFDKKSHMSKVRP